MRRKTGIIILLATFLLAALAACTNRNINDNDTPQPPTTPQQITAPPYQPTPPAASISNIHGALHRVVYGDNVAYIFGTMHGGRPYCFPLAEVVEDALRRADVIAVEIEEIGDSAAAMEAAILEASFLPAGLTWVDILPERYYNHLIAMMNDWGINYANAMVMNPAVVIYQIIRSIPLMFAEAVDIDFYASVDSYIASVANERGIPLIGLESIQQQVNILFNPPEDVLWAMIMHLQPFQAMTEDYLQSDELSLDAMAFLYRHNDFDPILQNLASTVYEDCLYLIYMNEIVMNWRSTYYANEIMRLLRDTEEPTTFFVAVGLSHVIRSQAHHSLTDIIQQLQFAGLTPEPLF